MPLDLKGEGEFHKNKSLWRKRVAYINNKKYYHGTENDIRQKKQVCTEKTSKCAAGIMC